jgi:hypothetical protein
VKIRKIMSRPTHAVAPDTGIAPTADQVLRLDIGALPKSGRQQRKRRIEVGISGLMLLGVAIGSMHLALPPSASTATPGADVQ